MRTRPFAPGRRTRRCGGYTIIEVVMAVFVLATAITTSILVLQRAFSDLDTARNLDAAGNILQCELEKERLLPWTRVADAAYQPAIDVSFLRNPSIAGRFTLSRAVAAVPGHSGQVVQVTLTVTWRGYDGRSLARSYTTYVGQGGLDDYLYQNQ